MVRLVRRWTVGQATHPQDAAGGRGARSPGRLADPSRCRCERWRHSRGCLCALAACSLQRVVRWLTGGVYRGQPAAC